MVVGAVFVVLVLNSSNDGKGRSDLSVHDINWSDYETMNEYIESMVYNIYPFFMNEVVATRFDLTPIFQWLYENQDSLRDQPLDGDFEIVLEFSNLTGYELFLNGKWSEEILNLSFYVDGSFANTALSLRSEAERAYVISHNPGLAQEDVTLSDINWLELLEDYELYISRIMLTRRQRVRQRPDLQYGLDIADFRSGEDSLAEILTFLSENQSLFSNVETEEHRYIGGINFIRSSQDYPNVTAIFYMNEELTRILSDDVIGEELWNLRQRGGQN